MYSTHRMRNFYTQTYFSALYSKLKIQIQIHFIEQVLDTFLRLEYVGLVSYTKKLLTIFCFKVDNI